jgi:hypothetical protein
MLVFDCVPTRIRPAVRDRHGTFRSDYGRRTQRLGKVEKLDKAGVISEAEARKKRQAILANL